MHKKNAQVFKQLGLHYSEAYINNVRLKKSIIKYNYFFPNKA